jgi:hypothetical protein
MRGQFVLNKHLIDSLPIITCSGKRKPTVTKELTDKGYCATKSMYYYGLRLHALAYHKPNHIPFPENIVITTASENDLNVHKDYWSNSIIVRIALFIVQQWSN